MTTAAKKLPVPDDDPVLRALSRARVGPPLTDEERRAKSQAATEGWLEAEDIAAEIQERCRVGE